MNDDYLDADRWMSLALEQAELAAAADEVPVGAVLVRQGKLLASAHNSNVSMQDPTAHAEILVLRQGAKIMNNHRLPGTTLYVTIEPCTMCVGAMIHARIDKLVFGAREPKAGAVVSHLHLMPSPLFNHDIIVMGGVMSGKCKELMQAFFRRKRSLQRRQRLLGVGNS
ncbi:MAG: tRNA adenosine(34) deaminase TadA [Gammaproteobacteria bacterium]|nr:tRNA adenosine(34) deaminase TadA [Gammaproteobacteria bacterium]MCY4358548.1 tRNA adenosine(34) deaminase TadA [Gammaproteobacteria bacterium]